MYRLLADISLSTKTGILGGCKISNWREHVKSASSQTKIKTYTHIAIMKSSWKLLPKILSGEKIVESRWYKTKACPWNRVFPGDTIYFKDSGKPVTLKARVTRVQQYILESSEDATSLFLQIKNKDLGIKGLTKKDIPQHVLDYISNKKYAIFVWFANVQKVKPFNIDKKGFGMQAAWLCAKDVADIMI